MTKKVPTLLKSFSILALFGLSFSALAVWTPPASAPTGNNTPSPINVGALLQEKIGALYAGGLATPVLQMTTPPVGGAHMPGYVLASDASGFGSWTDVNTLVTGGSGGMANPMTTLGDMIYGLAGGVPARLPVGSNGQVLTVNANGIPAWSTATGGGNVHGGGSGTVNFVTKWTTPNTIGNSQIFDNGTNVGIGVATPNSKLHVAGQIKITGGSPGNDKILSSDVDGLASWKTAEELGLGGGGGDSFSASWVLRGCIHDLAIYSDNPHMHPNAYFFIIPAAMNGWKLAHYSAGVCDKSGGSGSLTITPFIQRADGTTTSLSTLTMQAPNYVAQSNPNTTLNTGDKIRIQSTGTNGSLKGLTFSFRLEP